MKIYLFAFLVTISGLAFYASYLTPAKTPQPAPVPQILTIKPPNAVAEGPADVSSLTPPAPAAALTNPLVLSVPVSQGRMTETFSTWADMSNAEARLGLR